MSTSVTTPVTAGASTGTSGTTGTRFVVVALVSVVLSVAASTSVVALTGAGADPDRSDPAAVAEPAQGQAGAEQDAVEEDASDAITELGELRADSFCPASSYPAVAC